MTAADTRVDSIIAFVAGLRSQLADALEGRHQMTSEWTPIKCSTCDGHGQVSSYTFDGSDFLGAEECSDCCGSGGVWRSPKGALAMFPGGPFVGTDRTPGRKATDAK